MSGSTVVLATLGSASRCGGGGTNSNGSSGWSARTSRERTDAQRLLFELSPHDCKSSHVFPTQQMRSNFRHYLPSLPEDERANLQSVLSSSLCKSFPHFDADAYWQSRARPRSTDTLTASGAVRRPVLDYERARVASRSKTCCVDEDRAFRNKTRKYSFSTNTYARDNSTARLFP